MRLMVVYVHNTIGHFQALALLISCNMFCQLWWCVCVAFSERRGWGGTRGYYTSVAAAQVRGTVRCQCKPRRAVFSCAHGIVVKTNKWQVTPAGQLGRVQFCSWTGQFSAITTLTCWNAMWCCNDSKLTQRTARDRPNCSGTVYKSGWPVASQVKCAVISESVRNTSLTTVSCS